MHFHYSICTSTTHFHYALPLFTSVQASEAVYVREIPELAAAFASLCAAKATFHAACLQHFANVAAAPLVLPEAVSIEIEQLENGWQKRITFRVTGRRDCVYVLPAGAQGGDDVVVGSVAAMEEYIAGLA
jgi:hypothetical protein